MERKKTTSPYLKIRQSGIHGKGGFAVKDIPAGTRIIEYVGEKLTKAQSQIRADIPLNNHKQNKTMGAVYLFEINKRHDIDGYVPYNTARFINHCCEPNAETDIIKGRIWIIALRDIKKGEEITYNYGYTYEDYDDHVCHCGSKICFGYILGEDHWYKLKTKYRRKGRDGKARRVDRAIKYRKQQKKEWERASKISNSKNTNHKKTSSSK